jgi:hypothetical protein
MQKKLTIAAALLFFAFPLTAQDWSIGVATGPFVFGDFVERTLRPVNTEGPDEPITLTLSAATRAGVAVDVEHGFSDRWAVRLEGTFTRAPLSIKGGDDDGVDLDSGEIDVATFTLPIVFRINPRGSLRFHLLGGPAYAIYEPRGRSNASIPITGHTRSEWGVAFGAGAGWWLSDRFAIEGGITDVITTSPFDEMDDLDVPGVDVKKPHNVHTMIGVRWRL